MIKLLMLVFVAVHGLNAYAGEPECTKDNVALEVTDTYDIPASIPAHLKGATITVRLANGKESSVPAEKFKVVPRKQQFLVKKLTNTITNTCSMPRAPKRNRVAVLGGYGSRGGLDVNYSNSTVSSRIGTVGGVQYQYLLPALSDRLSVGGQAQTNDTYSLLVGIDF
jgi:hypothetical protein